MRCPECHTQNEANATACSSCGLLLFKAIPPKRRSEDFASQKRRSGDQLVTCQFCGGGISGRGSRRKPFFVGGKQASFPRRGQRFSARGALPGYVGALSVP